MALVASGGGAVPSIADLERKFQGLGAAYTRDASPDARARDRRLANLARLLRENMEAIAAAISADFGHRSFHETQLLEIFPSLQAVRHARRHLKEWMRPRRRAVSLWFQPGRASVIMQPLGVVGIIAPWNYPILLAAVPLVGALAAGNRAMLKMSELTPATAELFAGLVEKHFGDDEVAVILGDAEIGQAFASLPFDHLLFTGSGKVGSSVMRAAAGHLTPVTLELGGKSPAIVGPKYPLEHACERIVIGKMMNAGQTCIAPDYVLLPSGKEREFVATAQRIAAACYPDLGRTADYSTIVSERHYRRLVGYLNDARTKGAEVIGLAPEVAPIEDSRMLPPYVLLGTNDSMQLMQEEIFGPLLPVVPYRDLGAAIRYVNARPRPLALYYFDRDRTNVDRVLSQTISGGVTINDTILHIAQDDLPFGGVGASGMGHYHGREGFETFSKAKPVFYQSRINSIGLLNPPYRALFERMVRVLLR